MVWKRVNNSDAGDATHHGGDSTDKISDLFSGTSNVDTVDINSSFTVRDDKFKLRNPANTASYITSTSAITTDKTVTEPLLTADDTRVYQAFAQTLTNKTINTVDNTFNNRQCTMVRLSGSTYYAIKRDGTILGTPSADPEDAIQAALDEGGLIFLEPRSYTLSSGFTGFNATTSRWTLFTPRLTQFSVPNGFTGTFMTIEDLDHCEWNGGKILEAGTAVRDWTGFKILSATSSGCSYDRLRNIHLQDPGVGIHLETTTSGSTFVNGNLFDSCTISSPVIGVQFSRSDVGAGMTYNYFTDVEVQAAAGVTTDGFKDVQERSPVFVNCIVYDMDTGANQMNIDSTCSYAFVLGGGFGITSLGEFTDLGTNSTIITNGRPYTPQTADRVKIGEYPAAATTTSTGILASRIAEILVGAGPPTSAQGSDSTGIYRTYDTSSTINNLAGFQSNNAFLRRIRNATFKTAIYLNSVTNVRVFAGLVASTSAPASSADPLNALEGIGLWLDSAVSGDFKIMHNDSSGASTVDALSPAVTAGTATLYPLEIMAISDSKFRFKFQGVATDVSSNIPASTTGLCFRVYMENTTGSSRTYRMYYVVVSSDK